MGEKMGVFFVDTIESDVEGFISKYGMFTKSISVLKSHYEIEANCNESRKFHAAFKRGKQEKLAQGQNFVHCKVSMNRNILKRT